MKNKLIFLSIFLIFTFAVIIVTDLTLGNYIEISSIIGINVPITCKMETIDTHGARNEGETYTKIYFSEKSAKKFVEKIKENENWRELPLYSKLQTSLEKFECFDQKEKVAQNGYWFFYNRYETFSERFENPYNRYDEKEMYNSSSGLFNYSVAIFDTDTNILSYYANDM